jgi:putative transposase
MPVGWLTALRLGPPPAGVGRRTTSVGRPDPGSGAPALCKNPSLLVWTAFRGQTGGMAGLMPLLLRLAGADHAALARQVEYLVVENRILRSKIPGRVRLTERERQRLLRFGRAVGPALADLISVVKYETFRGWVRRKRQGKAKGRPGRPKTSESVEALIVRIARETGWGSERILGELRKLGVPSVCRTTVRNILKRHGIEPGPQRADPTWDTFLRRHAETLWACDFFMTRVLTERGWKWASVLAFIHVKTRRVIVTKATVQCGPEWSAEVAECVAAEVAKAGLPQPTVMVRDNDSRFGEPFDEALAKQGIRAEVLPVRSPLCNAHMERWIQSLRRECLDQFVPVGLGHLDHLVSEYIEHYHNDRPHQGLGNRLLGDPRTPGHDSPGNEGEVVCHPRLGGVLRHYERQRAA